MLSLKNLFLFIFILLFGINSSFGFDWLNLHQKETESKLNKGKESVAKDLNSIEDLYLRALAYLDKYQPGRAKELFKKILKIEPSNLPAKWGVVECLRREHQCQDCQERLKTIIEKRADFAPAYITLAYLSYLDKDFEKTARFSYQVIKMGKDNVDLENYVRALGLFAGAKGMIAHYGGPFSKVINGRLVMPYLKKAEKIAPESAVVYFGLGSYYLLTPTIFGRNLDKAEEYLEKAIKADPKFSDIYVRLAQVYKAKGDTGRYKEYLDKALEIDPKNELALDVKSGRCGFICLE